MDFRHPLVTFQWFLNLQTAKKCLRNLGKSIIKTSDSIDLENLAPWIHWILVRHVQSLCKHLQFRTEQLEGSIWEIDSNLPGSTDWDLALLQIIGKFSNP